MNQEINCLKTINQFLTRCLILLIALLVPNCVANGTEPQATDPVAAGITFDFDRVDIKTFISAVSNFTGKNFIVTPEVHGEISIFCSTPLTVQAAFAVFQSVLDLHGYAAVEVGTVVKIVASGVASYEATPVIIGAQIPDSYAPDSIATMIYQVKNTEPMKLRSVIQGVVSKAGRVVLQDNGNTFMITDKTAHLRKLALVLESFDRVTEDRSTQTFVLSHAEVSQVAAKLQPYLSQFSEHSPDAAKPILLDDPRTNSLIVTAAERDLLMIKDLLKLLDVPRPESLSTVEVKFLEFADAASTAEVLKAQIQAESAKAQAASTQATVVAVPANNALIISGPPSSLELLEAILKQLDVPLAQVLVEAVIVEVSSKRFNELGIEWRGMDAPTEDSVRGFGGTSFPASDGESPLNKAATQPFDQSSGLALGMVKGTISFGGVEFLNIGALLHALQTNTDVNVLSTPRLMTLDNQEAEIVVGEERPYLKSSQTTDSDQLLRTYEFKDVGITLRLTPHISQGHLVRLNLFQEIKSFVTESDIGAITTTKRQARTTVVVEDGQTVVIGGLIRDDTQGTTLKVPCLGSLPLLGNLFKSMRRERAKTNLLIFITPHILATTTAAHQLSKDLIDDSQQQSGRPSHTEQLSDDLNFILDLPPDGH